MTKWLNFGYISRSWPLVSSSLWVRLLNKFHEWNAIKLYCDKMSMFSAGSSVVSVYFKVKRLCRDTWILQPHRVGDGLNLDWHCFAVRRVWCCGVEGQGPGGQAPSQHQFKVIWKIGILVKALISYGSWNDFRPTGNRPQKEKNPPMHTNWTLSKARSHSLLDRLLDSLLCEGTRWSDWKLLLLHTLSQEKMSSEKSVQTF